MTFAEKLTESMEALGWKPVNLAAELSLRGDEVSVITVERWMAGANEPTVSRALRIAGSLRLASERNGGVMGFCIDDLDPIPLTEPAHATKE